MRIACLHTAESNIAVFDAVAADGLSLHHTLRADLLTRAEAAGGLTDALRQEAADVLRGLAQGVDAVLLTCSTVGPAVDLAQGAIPVLRVDQALARQAVAQAGARPLLVLYAVATTLAPTQAIFTAEARPNSQIRYALVPGAWDRFRAGDVAGYHQAVADAADAAFADGVAVVALAQASMSGAARLTRRGTPLTSPVAALAALAALRSQD